MSEVSTQTEEDKMPFLGHLEELRWRLVRCAIAVVIVAVVIFIFKTEIFETVYLGMLEADFPTYKFFCWLGSSIGLEDSMCMTQLSMEDPFSNTMTGQFNATMMYSLVGGIIICFWCVIIFLL